MTPGSLFALLRRAPKAQAAADRADATKVTLAAGEAVQETLRQLSAGRRERYQRVVFRAYLVPHSPLDVAVHLPEGDFLGRLPPAAVKAHYQSLLDFARFGRPCCLAELKGSPASSRGFEAVLDFSSLHVG